MFNSLITLCKKNIKSSFYKLKTKVNKNIRNFAEKVDFYFYLIKYFIVENNNKVASNISLILNTKFR